MRRLTALELTLAVFLVWLMVEDLFRKLAGNDIRIYFVKYAVFLFVLLALAMHPGVRGLWRETAGPARFALYALVAWALFRAIPTALGDWRLAVVGLSLDFLYAPLALAGYAVACESVRLTRGLVFVAVIGALACLVGIIQAVLGPSFLAPSGPTPGLINLVLVRGYMQHLSIYRPTGTFVDPGRFASASGLVFTVALGAAISLRGKGRLAAATAAMIAGAAIWLSGGRTELLLALTVTGFAAAGLLWRGARLRLHPQTVLIGLAAALLVFVVGPALFGSRLSWYWNTLNPLSPTNEWIFRWRSYASSTVLAARLGGLFGLGTGLESLGKQYLYGGPTNSPIGLYRTEGGYASLAAEWGLVGLALWIVWTLAWLRRQVGALVRTGSGRWRGLGFVILGWSVFFLVIGFFTGLQEYQNYLTNAYFWLLSGVLFALPAVDASPVRTPVRPRIWIVTPELHRHGGTERSLVEQIVRWKGRFDMRLYTMRTEGVDLDGIPVVRTPWLPGPHLPRYVWWLAVNTLVRWWDAQRRGAPDAVYSPGVNCLDADVVSVHIIFAQYWARVASRVQADLSRRETSLKAMHRIAYWSLIRRLESRVFARTPMLWCVSHAEAAEVERRYRRPRGSTSVIPHGVDADSFSPGRRRQRRRAARARLGVGRRRVCLAVGNDVHKKGFDVAIAALRRLPEDVVLAIAGNNDAALIARLAAREGVGGRVLVWPLSPEVIDYYAAADVLVAPSREDAFNMPVLEAMACGMPVVVSRMAGVAEQLRHEQDSLILEDPEDAAALAGLLQRVTGDTDLARQLSSAGRARAEAASWDANAEAAARLITVHLERPHVLVLAADPAGVGGIQTATRTLLNSLSELVGAERLGLLQVWDLGKALPECRVLHAGAAPARRGQRVGLVEKARFLASSLVSAWRWRDRDLVLIAVHAHLAPAAWLSARLAGRPFAVWCHGREAWGPLRATVRVALRSADVVFTSNTSTANRLASLAGLRPQRLRIVPYGMSKEFSPPAGGSCARRQVLSVARLQPDAAYKGIDTLLYAWPQVLARVPDAELRILGDGPDRPRLAEIARALDIEASVHFEGLVSGQRLNEAYAESSLFALPGRQSLGRQPEGEGFGLVFVEAGAVGLPVVAGRAGGTEDAVDEERGMLVDPEDPYRVAQAIAGLLAVPERADRMGEAGRERAPGRFSYEAFTRSLAALLGSLTRTQERLASAAYSG